MLSLQRATEGSTMKETCLGWSFRALGQGRMPAGPRRQTLTRAAVTGLQSQTRTL